MIPKFRLTTGDDVIPSSYACGNRALDPRLRSAPKQELGSPKQELGSPLDLRDYPSFRVLIDVQYHAQQDDRGCWGHEPVAHLYPAVDTVFSDNGSVIGKTTLPNTNQESVMFEREHSPNHTLLWQRRSAFSRSLMIVAATLHILNFPLKMPLSMSHSQRIPSNFRTTNPQLADRHKVCRL